MENAANPTETIAESVQRVLADVLTLKPAAAAALHAETPLFGSIPELDSMAVAGLLTELEDRFGIIIDDDDVDSELFATFGSLVAFVEGKVAN